MLCRSTKGRSPEATFREALLRGIAPDGGLYLPAELPALERKELESWRGLSFRDVAVRLSLRLLHKEFAEETIERLVGEALSFPVPTVQIENGYLVTELFHGPTLAFKDFGARFLGRFFGHLLERLQRRSTILVATSGDTGSAVAQGFQGVDGVTVVVLYPRGRVTPFQEAQMATLGGNVVAVRVPGTFDDCQRLVKAAFLDPALAAMHLSSANSINLGRLLPQAYYYVMAWLEATSNGAPVSFSVPSGNIGNLTAGVMAARMGISVRRFIAATNSNSAVKDFISTGHHVPRPAIPTISNAMDVGDPSNLPRLNKLFAGALAALRDGVRVVTVSEEQTRACIRETYARTGYMLDPHGAVGYFAARAYRANEDDGVPVVTLATAHPAKFSDVIQQELGLKPDLPPALRGWEKKARLAQDLPDTKYDSFRDFLLARL
jgi:threonine synthase